MDSNTRTKLIRSLCIVVAITFLLLVIILVNLIQSSTDIAAIISEQIELTKWPEEIPVIESKFVKINKYEATDDNTSDAWSIGIKSGVSYEEFRQYLLKLDTIGFKPVKEKGSKSPKLLNMNPVIDEDFIVCWYGKLDRYNIEVYWQNIDPDDKTNNKKYVFRTLLYMDVENKSGDVSGDMIYNSGDSIQNENLSGEVFTSGDLLEVSGDI